MALLAWITAWVVYVLTALWHWLMRHRMALAWLAMLIFAIHASTHMVAAGDTWVAMACGRHFVNHGVDTVEPFSANSHDAGPTEEEIKTWPGWARWITDKVGLETVKKWHPTGWVNQNWLTHVIFYSLSTTLGSEQDPYFNALVFWKFALYILAVICVYYTGRLLGAHRVLAAVLACFALFTGRSFLDVRPAGFSNLLVAVFLLILVLTSYRHILWIWLMVPLAVFWCNVHGGYVYEFIMLVPFIGLHFFINCNKKWAAILYNATAWPFYGVVVSVAGLTLSTLLFFLLLVVLDILLVFYKDRLVSIGWRGLYHTLGATAVAFVAMVLLNPFHLTNLTHTFIISVSEHAERWRDIHEWQPAFDWTNPVGTAVPFLILYIVAWLLLAVWVAILLKTRRLVAQSRSRKARNADEYEQPKIDLPFMAIAALTIYMALRSRRFIPVAAIAACPVLAMFMNQVIRVVSATRNFQRRNRLVVSPMPHSLRVTLVLVGIAAVLFFGIFWGRRFKRVYLDPWPNDPRLDSIFIRMTASDAKPFYAGEFIRLNELEGKMFNYWTEGGFIAWAQNPDPNTGKTPLQLFMDGRAQAAYDRRTFDIWTYIMAGGLPGSTGHERMQKVQITARMRGKLPKDVMTSADYIEIGKSIAEELQKRDVWVTLMPAKEFDSVFARSLEHNRNWAVVFINNKQKMFVDVRTRQGRELFYGILNGKTRFPDKRDGGFSRMATQAHRLLLYGMDNQQRRQGFDLAAKAFNLNPSSIPMIEMIVIAARFAELRPRVEKFCKDYYESFEANKQEYSGKAAYRLKLEAARLACVHLQAVAAKQRNTKLAQFYEAKAEEYEDEREQLANTHRW
jgi:hypothetical protein